MANNHTRRVLTAQRATRARRDLRFQIFGAPKSIQVGDPMDMRRRSLDEGDPLRFSAGRIDPSKGDQGNYFSPITFATSIKVDEPDKNADGDITNLPDGQIIHFGDVNTSLSLYFDSDGDLSFTVGESIIDSPSGIRGKIPQITQGYEGDIIISVNPSYHELDISTKTRKAGVGWVKIYGESNKLLVDQKSTAPFINGWAVDSPSPATFGQGLLNATLTDTLWVFEDNLPKNFYGGQAVYTNDGAFKPITPPPDNARGEFDPDEFGDGFATGEGSTNG